MHKSGHVTKPNQSGSQKTEMVMIQASQELNTQAILKKWRRWSVELSVGTQRGIFHSRS